MADGERLKEYETATRKGTAYTKAVSSNAHETLAEGEFNRFYIRAVCLRALQEGFANVRVHRAKNVSDPRSESQTKIGELIRAETLLNDLRSNIGVDSSLGLPSGPNSGLSVELTI